VKYAWQKDKILFKIIFFKFGHFFGSGFFWGPLLLDVLITDNIQQLML